MKTERIRKKVISGENRQVEEEMVKVDSQDSSSWHKMDAITTSTVLCREIPPIKISDQILFMLLKVVEIMLQ